MNSQFGVRPHSRFPKPPFIPLNTPFKRFETFEGGVFGANAETITSHGISTFGELKYPADSAYLDHMNPDTPKGGEISIRGFGPFASIHPYTTKGRAGHPAFVFFGNLPEGIADESDAVHGLSPNQRGIPPTEATSSSKCAHRRNVPTARR